MTIQEMIDQIDIIIPAYHAEKKLQRTIFSFGSEYCYHFIVIIDGPDGVDYQKELEIFNGIHDITLHTLEKNSGPGVARNVGIKMAQRDLITFADSGDTLVGCIQFNNYLKQAIDHPEYNILSAAHYEERDNTLQTIAPAHNRMHGKIFRRQFLIDHNIFFNPKCARANEDIGINMTARMVSREQSLQDGVDHICHYTDPIMCWKNDPDSITRRNECAFYYKENNMGLAKNGSYAIELAAQNGVRQQILDEQIYSILVSLFNFYFATKNFRPEFLEEQEEGAVYFVKRIMENRGIDYNIFTRFYNQEMAGTYAQAWNPFTLKIPDMTFMQWYGMIKEKAKTYDLDSPIVSKV